MSNENDIIDAIKRFAVAPDDLVFSPPAAAVILGDLSVRTVRAHPHLRRVYTSADRFGYTAGDLRRLIREGVPDRRIRAGPVGARNRERTK
jgi:hypothetical protein